MTLARRLLRSGSAMMVVQATNLLLTFARNVLLARMLGPEQFGVAATYAMVMGFLEASFEFGPDKYILQASDGGRSEVLAAAHTFTVARGLLAGLVLFLAAGPIAALFHVPDLAWAYQMLAAAPIIKGFINFDFRVAQRELSFRSEMIMLVAANAAGLFVALAAALLHPSHIAMLASVLVQVTTLVALSFGLSKTPYRLGFGRAELGALFGFGWPLVANSVVLTAAMQGDRALVGAVFGPETLAVYVTAAILAGAPFLIALRTVGNMTLPVLGPMRGQPQFESRYRSLGAGMAMIVIVIVPPTGLLGALVIPIVFGDAYRPDAIVVAALAAAGGVSLMRAWTNLAALAVGNTKATLHTNLVRLSGLALAAVAALAGGGLAGVAVAMLTGEVVALGFGLMRTHRTNNLRPLTGFSFLAPTVGAAITLVPLAPLVHGSGWQTTGAATLGLQVLALLTLLAVSSNARHMLIRAVFGAAS